MDKNRKQSSVDRIRELGVLRRFKNRLRERTTKFSDIGEKWSCSIFDENGVIVDKGSLVHIYEFKRSTKKRVKGVFDSILSEGSVGPKEVPRVPEWIDPRAYRDEFDLVVFSGPLEYSSLFYIYSGTIPFRVLSIIKGISDPLEYKRFEMLFVIPTQRVPYLREDKGSLGPKELFVGEDEVSRIGFRVLEEDDRVLEDVRLVPVLSEEYLNIIKGEVFPRVDMLEKE